MLDSFKDGKSVQSMISELKFFGRNIFNCINPRLQYFDLNSSHASLQTP